jgi:hypothetical protein
MEDRDMYRAQLYREGIKGFTVWIVSPHTGDKKDCLGHFNTKREALRTLRAYNRRSTSGG